MIRGGVCVGGGGGVKLGKDGELAVIGLRWNQIV